VANTTLERRLLAARPETDDGEQRLEAMVASRLFGPTQAPPARIGRFTLLERIGRGGMGDVYGAYDPVLDRKVALKVLRGDAGRLDAGLLAEARAAARLAHPNVVAIHEVGDDGDGVYIAMEFIAGVTLRAWLGERRSIAAILGVFVQAGRGLAAAHDAGVVHRDFKPENVLIDGDGAEPRVRVVDFGLARSAAGRPTEGAAGDSTWMGTPAYMSPEQLLRRPVDARSDQFSFCVALHEALTGRHPFGADEPGTAGEQVLARIVAQARPVGERSLPGWLRQVLRRGLMPEPAARHPSMHALLRELRATPERRRRRLRVGVGVGLVLVSSAITLAGRDRLGAAPCVEVAEELRGVWDGPVRAASRAAFAASGLANAAEVWQRVEPRVDEYAEAWLVARRQGCLAGREGGSAEPRQLAEGCLLRRRAELAGLTALLVEADAATMLAAIEALDQLTPISVCDDGEGLRREVATGAPGADPAALEAMRQEILGLTTGVRAGHPREVSARAEALTEAARAQAGPAVLAEALLLRGLVEEALGEHDAAATSLTAAVHEAIAGRHDRLHAELAVRLVWLHGVQRQRSAEARAWVDHAEAAIRAIRGEPILAARLLDHRGSIAGREHDYATAEGLHRQAIATRAGASPHAQIEGAMSLSNLGLALLSQGKHEAAGQEIAAALERYREVLGPQHPTVAAVLSNLGQAQVKAGEPERGLALLHEALALKERGLGREHVALMTTLNNLGSTYSALGRGAQAREHYLRALAIGERALGPDSPQLEALLHNLAFEAWQEGAFDEVIVMTSRALALQRGLHGESNPILAPTLELLARGQLGVGRIEEAAATIERALTLADTLEPAVRGSLLLSAAWIRRAAGATPERVRPLADEAERLLGPAVEPDQARELAALRGR
jgi:tetratricopeptide (TPR) repeat protein